MPSILVIGAGSRIGQATADIFAADGYAVATASRSAKPEASYPHFIFDASRPQDVVRLFEEMHKQVGIPSVVVYNAYAAQPSEQDPFRDTVETVEHDLRINSVTPYVVAREAIKGFEKIGGSGTCIFTGNLLDVSVAAGFMTFGMGKTAVAHMVKHLALVAYEDRPYTFYYADQRKADGSPLVNDLSGPAHAQLYLDLARDEKQRAWRQTFVEGRGYVKFEDAEVWRP